jgi:uncharacterized membrane protein (TIGR02234 family)
VDQRRAGRELAAVLVACAAGAGAALLAASRGWLRLAAPRTPPLPELAVTLAGRDLEPLVPALGVVGLAGLVALLATRRRGRLVVGAVLAAAGLALMLRALPYLAAPGPAEARDLLLDQGRATGEPPGAAVAATTDPAGPLLAAVGGAAMLLGGVGTVLRSRRWPGMSARYDAPSSATAPDQTPAAEPGTASDKTSAGGIPTAGEAWDALDRGEDPTAL